VKPYLLADAETDLRRALDGADALLSQSAGAAVDRLDPHPAHRPGDAALWYVAHGLHVFPCKPSTKVPATRHGVKDATLDDTVVAGWWTAMPTANIGIATGWLLDVLDFDGEGGHASWGEHHGGSWGGLRRVGVASTPRPGGLHIYVPTIGIRGRTKSRAKVYPGVDYRCLGGYVIAPPSVLDDRDRQVAGTYRWIRPLNLDALDHGR
jgi:hypothetical protein